MSVKSSARLLLGAALVSGTACSHLPFRRGAKPAPLSARPAAAAPAAAASRSAARVAAPKPRAGAPSDANVTAILLAADNTDISYARLVAGRAQSQAVKDFATQMAADHAGINRLISDLLTRNKLDPQDNMTSLGFRDESSARRDMLRELKGHAFDTTYMANEVSYHSRLLASIDNSLLPSSRNSDLRQLLTSIRPAVAGHLARAQQIMAGLEAR